jgi:ketosteroid isomerase-like protein
VNQPIDLETFAREWLAAWNAHDLDRILAMYEPDFEFSSPVLAQRVPASGGWLRGHDAARAYWTPAFAPGVNPRFEPIAVLAGVDSVVIHYRGLRGKLCAEFFQLGAAGRIVRSHAHEAAAA